MKHAAALPALALLAGVTLGASFPAEHLRWIALGLAGACATAITGFLSGHRGPAGVGLVVAFAAAGALVGAAAQARAVRPSLVIVLEEQRALGEEAARDRDPVVIDGVLRDDAIAGPDGVRLSLDVVGVTIDGLRREARGGALVSVAGTLAAERAGAWRAGAVIRVPAFLRRPSRYLNAGAADDSLALARRGVAILGAVKSAALVDVLSPPPRAGGAAAAARDRARRAIARHVASYSQRSAAIVTAILIGDRAGLDDEVERRLQEAGTYHVIAISGGNIAILAGMVLGAMRLIRLWDRRAMLVPAAVLALYAIVVGGGASVARATVMAVTYLAARLGDHRTAALNALAVAAGVIVVVVPLSVFDAGFVLTVGATAGILMGSTMLAGGAGTRGLARAAVTLFAATLCAEIALAPVSAFVFGRVTFAGLPLNFVAVPAMTIVQMAGMAVVALAPFAAWLATAAGGVAHAAAEALVRSAELVDLAPWLTYRVPPPSLAMLAIYYGSWSAWLLVRSTTGFGAVRWYAARLALACAAASGLWMLAAPATLALERGDGRLRVTFLDVGQGDATFVRFPNGRSLLVDAGGAAGPAFDVGARVVAPALWALGVRRLDYLAITHGDPDHMDGATAIVRDFEPSEVWYGVPVPPHAPTMALRAEATRWRVPWRTLQSGDVLEVGGAALRVWHPPPPDWERQDARNDDSLVFEITFGDVSVLLTGDIGQDVERDLATRRLPGRVRALKIPHHGSATSSSAVFLAAIRPDVAIVSCGRGNRYGHPVPRVLDRYRAFGVPVYRTDLDGAITIATDGSALTLTTFGGRTRKFYGR